MCSSCEEARMTTVGVLLRAHSRTNAVVQWMYPVSRYDSDRARLHLSNIGRGI
jgi:hypothetical protein